MRVLNFILVFILLSGLSLTACQLRKSLREDAIFKKTIPVCDTKKQCDAVWEAAYQWVDEYSPQGIDYADENIIKSEEIDMGSQQLEIKVLKVPLGGEKHQVVIDVWCNTDLSSCSTELNNMIAFNKAMSHYVSNTRANETIETLASADGVDAFFDEFFETLNHEQFKIHAESYLIPATIIHGDEIKVYSSFSDAVTDTESMWKQLEKRGIKFLKPESRDVLSTGNNSLTVNVVWGFYDDDGTRTFNQSVTYNLIKKDTRWKILSANIDA